MTHSAPALGDLLEQVADWADGQFPDATWQSASKHLLEEALEASAAEGDGEELADLVMIVAHMARMKHVDLYTAIERKLAICRAREWLPADADGVVRHAR